MHTQATLITNEAITEEGFLSTGLSAFRDTEKFLETMWDRATDRPLEWNIIVYNIPQRMSYIRDAL